MAQHGGKREGAGRKPKAEEDRLIEKLDLIIEQDKALDALKSKVYKGDIRALELYMKYRFGMPKQKVDVTTNDEPFILTLNGTKSKTD